MKCGIDIVDSSRIERILNRRDPAWLTHIWTGKELAECTNSKGILKPQSLAARFACKEAVAKALGTGILSQGVRLCEIEIQKKESGEPFVTLYGKARECFEQSGYSSLSVSLTHTKDIAAAVCVIG